MTKQEYFEEYGYEDFSDGPGPSFCLDCEEEVRIVEVDFGIGPYEFQGARGVHHDKRWVCEKCEGNNYCDDPVRCHRCGKWISAKQSEGSDPYWCDECVQIATEECEGCGDFFTAL